MEMRINKKIEYKLSLKNLKASILLLSFALHSCSIQENINHVKVSNDAVEKEEIPKATEREYTQVIEISSDEEKNEEIEEKSININNDNSKTQLKKNCNSNWKKYFIIVPIVILTSFITGSYVGNKYINTSNQDALISQCFSNRQDKSIRCDAMVTGTICANNKKLECVDKMIEEECKCTRQIIYKHEISSSTTLDFVNNNCALINKRPDEFLKNLDDYKCKEDTVSTDNNFINLCINKNPDKKCWTKLCNENIEQEKLIECLREIESKNCACGKDLIRESVPVGTLELDLINEFCISTNIPLNQDERIFKSLTEANYNEICNTPLEEL